MKIAVIGHSCSGKTILADALAKIYPDHKVIRADIYKDHGFESKTLMEDVIKAGDMVICEGVQAVHMLRRGAEIGRVYFDVVINCSTDENTQMSRYTTERDASKWHYIPAFNKSLDTVLTDYKRITKAIGRIPVFLEYKT